MPSPSPSVLRRSLQIFFAVLFCLFCSGIIFGFAAIKPVLVSEGVYAELCEGAGGQEGKKQVCEQQDIRLNLIFTYAAVATSVAGLPTGYLLDNLGPRTASIIGGLLMTAGSLLFGTGYQSPFIDSYILGYLLIALGGPLICLSSFHLSNAFPAISGMILSAVTGSFDASSMPLVAWEFWYQGRGEGTPNVKGFFWGYAILPLLLVVQQLLIGAPTSYQRPLRHQISTSGNATDSLAPQPTPTSLIAASSSGFFSISEVGQEVDEEEMEALAEKDPIVGLLVGMSAGEQIRSRCFLLLTLFVCVHMTRFNFYIASVDAQLESFLGPGPQSESLTRLFSALVPLGGLAAIPFIGLLLSLQPYQNVLLVNAVMGLAFGLLGLTRASWSQIVGMAFFVAFRPLLYTTVGEGVGKIMGYSTFGTIYGLAMTIAGVVALVNAPLDAFIKTQLHNQYSLVDGTLLVLGAVTSLGFAGWVWMQTKGRGVVLE